MSIEKGESLEDLTETKSTEISEISEVQKQAGVANYVKQAEKEGLLALDFFEMSSAYPKAFKMFTEYLQNQAKAPIDEEMCVGVLLYSARTILYDFFDKQKVFINTLGYDDKWYFTLERIGQSKETYKNRAATEKAAFNDAFEYLEKNK